MGAFQLFLFSTDPAVIRRAVGAGVAAVVVDWERHGKHGRQVGADTQISTDTYKDLERVRSSTDATVVCRVNAIASGPPGEIDAAIAAGADELLLPMARSVDDVQEALDLVAGRVPLGILVETRAAIESHRELARLPLARVYVGLNDLAIDRGDPNIFNAVGDGTVESLRAAFDVPFGFGGLTSPDRGRPIPSRLLVGEMARLACDFSFLRRSFHADTQERPIESEVPRILEAIDAAGGRSREAVAADRAELEVAIERWAEARAAV